MPKLKSGLKNYAIISWTQWEESSTNTLQLRAR